MKKIFTLIVAFIAITQMLNAQASHGAMTFVGKSNYYVTMMGSITGETTVAADTIVYMGADFTLPSMKYNDMVIPSFSIQGTTFTGGYAGVIWEDQTFTSTTTDASDQEKTITGSSLRGTFTHTAGIYKLQLEITFTYGNMPFPITYSIEGYYVKDYSGTNKVTVGGQYGPYSAQVTHKLRTYVEDGETKADVEIPGYTLPQTIMGNLTLGSYTITGLTYDESKGGYYKDYATDGLTIHITAEQNGLSRLHPSSHLRSSSHLTHLRHPHAQEADTHFYLGQKHSICTRHSHHLLDIRRDSIPQRLLHRSLGRPPKSHIRNDSNHYSLRRVNTHIRYPLHTHQPERMKPSAN